MKGDRRRTPVSLQNQSPGRAPQKQRRQEVLDSACRVIRSMCC